MPRVQLTAITPKQSAWKSRGCDLIKLAVSDLPQRCYQTNRLKHQKPQEGAYSHASLVINKSLFIMKALHTVLLQGK